MYPFTARDTLELAACNEPAGEERRAPPSCPKPCSTRSGTPIWSRGAPTAATSSISTATCCTSCTRRTRSSSWRSSGGRCADPTSPSRCRTTPSPPSPGATTAPIRPGAAFLKAMREGSRRNGIRLFDLDDPGAGHLARGRARARHGAAGRDPCGARQPCQHGGRPRRARLRLRHDRARAYPGDAGDGDEAAEAHADAARRQARRRMSPPRTWRCASSRELGVAGARGHVVEYAGAAVRAMPIESRMTLCNLNIEMGGRSGFVAPDDTAFSLDRRAGPTRRRARCGIARIAHWRTLAKRRRRRIRPRARARLQRPRAADHLGHRPEPGARHFRPRARSVGGSEAEPARRDRKRARLHGARARAWRSPACRSNRVFIGSCTNARLPDLEAAADVVRGRRVADGVIAMVVPGLDRR